MDQYAEWLNGQHKTIAQLWDEQDFFRLEEIVSQKTFLARGEKSIELFNPYALYSLIETRILFGVKMRINDWLWGGRFHHRGHRGNDYYRGKITFSQHPLGNAFDYDVEGYTAEEARLKLIQWKREGKLKFLTGIEEGVNWVHNDYRVCRRLDSDGLFLFKAA